MVADEAAGAFRSEIVEGSADSPAFRVTLDAPEGEPMVRAPAQLSQCGLQPGQAHREGAKPEAFGTSCLYCLPCDMP